MTTIHFTEVTTLTPAQFIAGLTDFGPGRGELFTNSHDNELKVHSQGPGYADVTEGASGVWERLSYDWSDPHRIVLTTTDSNVWGGASSHTYTLTQLSDGTTEIDVVIVRDGKNLKGHLLSFAFAAGGKRLIHKAFDNTIRAMESRTPGNKLA